MRHELHDHNGSFDCKDQLLAALVRIAQRRDRNAVGAVVALLLPGLKHRARRQYHLGWEDAFDEMVAALCGHILRYDTARHPSHVAADLLQRSSRDLKRTAARAWAHVQRVCPLEAVGEIPEPCTGVVFTDRLLLASVTESGTMSRSDAALMYATYFVGVPLRDAARALGIGYEAAKKRCQRARRRYAIWWLDHEEPT